MNDNDKTKRQLIEELSEARQHIAELAVPEVELRKFSQAVEQSPVSIVITDLQGNISYVNPKFTSLTGYTFEEVIGQNPRILKTDHTASEEYQRLWETITAGREWQGEFLNKKKNGDLYWEAATISPIIDINGEITHYLAVKEDITERKRVEEVLRESKERYRLLSELASDYAYSYRVNPEGQYHLEWITDESWYHITGYTRADFDQTISLYHPGDLPLFEQDMRDLMAGQHTESEYRIITKSGEQRWIHMSRRPVWDDNENRVIRFYGVGKDITERKQSEKALRESEEKLRELFEGIDDAVFVHDKEANILAVNEAACRRLGYSRDELLQMKTTDIDAPDYAVGFKDRLNQQLAAGGLSQIGGVHVTKDGRQIFIDVNTKTITYQGQTAILAVCRDITERKQAEQQRLQLTLERERMQLLANFIAKAAHEFRTPLAIINTSTYLLRKADNHDDRERHAHKIEDQVNDVAKLVDALIIMSKLDTIQELSVVSFDLNSIVKIVYDTRQSDFEDVKHNVVLELSAKPLLMQGDYDYLLMAVENILDNAIRYTSAGGTITVLTGHVGGNAVIEITDTGAGISDEQLSHIFERFYRADVAGTTRGLGLGLPIAKSIIERHNGKIEVESEVGKGSTFRVLLPLE